MSMTAQEVFTKVATHMLTQGRKSQAPKSAGLCTTVMVCLYRGPDGLKCAAGCLIPDTEYDPDFEHLSVRAQGEPKAEKFKAMWQRIGLHDHLYLIRRMQQIHDLEPVEDWREALETLAEELYDQDGVQLQVPVVGA